MSLCMELDVLPCALYKLMISPLVIESGTLLLFPCHLLCTTHSSCRSYHQTWLTTSTTRRPPTTFTSRRLLSMRMTPTTSMQRLKPPIEAENVEHDMGVLDAVKAYPMAATWAFVMSCTIVRQFFAFAHHAQSRIASNMFARLWRLTVSSSWVVLLPCQRLQTTTVFTVK
jgi:hypothetical protein